jgi:hypothetical protein
MDRKLVLGDGVEDEPLDIAVVDLSTSHLGDSLFEGEVLHVE